VSFRVVKYEPPTIIVTDVWGRMERFLVADDGTVENRGTQHGLAEFRRTAVRYLETRREITPRRHDRVLRWSSLMRD
jgi:hypothetical protein